MIGCLFPTVHRLICFLHAFFACRFARHASFRPPRRLSPRFPRRFLADYQSSRLPAVHADFITFVPRSFRLLGTSIVPPKRCRPRQTNSRQPIAQPIRIAFGRNIISRNHVASRRPCRLPVPILRRLDRLVAWLREGRGGEAWHTRSERIGTAPDNAGQICPIPYRMPVPAGHRGSGYPILILLRHGKWAGCGMRVETSIGCDIEHAGISRSPPKFHPM